MSNQNNDQLYDRAYDLIPYLSGQDALDLNGALEDLDALYELVKCLEDKYLGQVQDDVPITLRGAENASQGVNRQDFTRFMHSNYIGDPEDADLGRALDEYESRGDYER